MSNKIFSVSKSSDDKYAVHIVYYDNNDCEMKVLSLKLSDKQTNAVTDMLLYFGFTDVTEL